MVVLQASSLSVKDVHQRLGYVREYVDHFEDCLVLDGLTPEEQSQLFEIRSEFDRYLVEGDVLEGQVRLLTLNPLLRLSGFMRSPILIQTEVAIAPIVLSESKITGRLDLLAIRKQADAEPDFWVLVVESKESGADALQGLAQLLTYAYPSLATQRSVWGMTTNGINYQFVKLQAGEPPQYFLLPELSLLHRGSAIVLLQVLKAICLL